MMSCAAMFLSGYGLAMLAYNLSRIAAARLRCRVLARNLQHARSRHE